MKQYVLLCMLLVMLIEPVFAAHFIIGFVNDSHDGESANGKTIVLWNPEQGIADNRTDTIGPTGNSGQNNTFMVDCELLGTPCTIGDVLSVYIVNAGDNYTSEISNVTVTGAGFDEVPTFRMNSPPQPLLITPLQSANLSGNVAFNCSWVDLDSNVAVVNLWGNWTGVWQQNDTVSVLGGESSKTFTKSIEDGTYQWTCFAEDNLTTGRFATQNRTFTIDNTPPIISSVQTNESSICNSGVVRVNCTVSDELLEVDTIIIQSIAPDNTQTNYTTTLLSGETYYTDIFIMDPGYWTFMCIANDTVGNEENRTSNQLRLFPEYDLIAQNIVFNTTPLIESEIVNITLTIENAGCQDTTNIVAGFYNGDKDSGGISLSNQTITLTQNTTQNISMLWSAEIGLSNIFGYIDLNETVTEVNETNNAVNRTTYLTAWQEIYGNTTTDKRLGAVTAALVTNWSNETSVEGNIFITDTESTIDWYSLQALGRDEFGLPVADDFSDLDTALSMTSFNDSVYNLFTNSGTPKELRNFTLFQYQVENVAVIHSTNNEHFKTGILWDTTDDSTNNGYDTTDKEDIVFVAAVNKSSPGKYGLSDYEIRIPARLREYYTLDSEDVYYYYELN